MLRLDPLDDLLRLIDQFIQLPVRSDVEVAEPLKEGGQVLHGAVPKDFGFSVTAAGQPFAEMRHQVGQFLDKCLFGQLHRFIEPRLHAAALLLVQFRRKLLQVARGFDGRKLPRDVEQSRQ